ncbi:phosphoribosyltransferase family protein [Solwaraspora sp. WMMD1047]|uniref:phosphoribosyltransferase family protein n=1 Tax=Solwaraspora sp. WMMD1047 TaxID=3016102 RepID=UPI002415ECD2|nr:phosphoribosyltransferase family protein [Solwaraspora sp. WMMD1047]MDG4834579.1 phosphoribosyltransferase family protein [Solwaraspora sp. WMMD1047]
MRHDPTEPLTGLTERLIATFRWIDPGPQAGHLVSDVSGWWRDATILAGVGAALADPFRAERPTVVVAPEVTGLLLGPLVAVALGVGFLPAYKGGSDRAIPEPTTWARTGPDHRGRALTLGVRDRHLGKGDRVLVVDDWVSTGAQARALREVIRARGARPVGTAAVVADCPPEVARELGLRALLPVSRLDG